MSESEYLGLADACLERVTKWIDGLDADEIDYSTRDGMVSLEFPDGARFVLNRQGPARQMWLAAESKVLALFHAITVPAPPKPSHWLATGFLSDGLTARPDPWTLTFQA